MGISLLAKRIGLPYAVTLRGWLYQAMQHPRILQQCIGALRDASAIIGVSEHLVRTAIKLGAPESMAGNAAWALFFTAGFVVNASYCLALMFKRRNFAGSLIGGIPETQEMLDFCAEHGVVSDVEVIPMQKINEAYERMLKGDVRYRFVIDIASLK